MKELDRLCRYKRGIKIKSKIQYSPKENSDTGWNPEQILSITGIDGALFMNFAGKCLAMGVIVDGEAKTPGNIGRGARYNSIANYINLKKKGNYIGIIVSEDGMIDIISKK